MGEVSSMAGEEEVGRTSTTDPPASKTPDPVEESERTVKV